MLIPVRCWTCNASVGQHWPAFVREHLHTPESNFNHFCARHGIPRYCCRRMLLCHVDVGHGIASYTYTDTNDGTSQFRCAVADERTLSCD